MAVTMPSAGDVFTPDPARPVAWIVYINGIETPCTSATVSYGVWKIPECQLTLVPDVNMHRFGAEDRVSVQVFYCDYWVEPDNPQFRLMFDGEIVAWSYVNVKEGRSLVFNCVDYIQIFTQLFFFFMSSIDDFTTGASGEQLGQFANGLLPAGYAATFPYSLFSRGLIDPASAAGDQPQGVEVITRPIDFVYNVIRALIKWQLPNRTIPAANFFAPWTKRTRFHRRFLALPGLEEAGVDAQGQPRAGIFPILRAVQSDAALAAMTQLITQSPGNAGSVWETISTLLKTTMTELMMLPTAPLVVSDYESLQIRGSASVLPTTAVTPSFLGNYFVKPQFLFGIPPTCNVFFPSQIARYAYDETYITQPTRLYIDNEAFLKFLDTNNEVNSSMGTLIRDALAVAHPEEANFAVRNRLASQAQGNDKNLLIYPEEFYKGPVVDRRPMPRWFFFLQNAQATTPGTPGALDVGSIRQSSPGDPARDVFRLYAAYEFFKERYSQRTGALHLTFTPYPVPGFPCAVFDRRSEPLDTIGYIMTVNQTLMSNGWSTSVSYSYGRTFQEMFQLVQEQFAFEAAAARLESQSATVANPARTAPDVTEAAGGQSDGYVPVGAIATAPPEPIVEIRDVIQNFDRAEGFYRTLFHRDSSDLVLHATDAELTTPREIQSFLAVESPSAQYTVESATASNSDATGANPLAKRAAFYYPDLIRLGTSTGAQDIQLEGFSAQAKVRLLEILSKLSAGTVSDLELQEAQTALGQPSLAVGASNIAQLEQTLRLSSPTTNLTGDADILVKDAARELFESYDAAMRYCARPICTLDEYINFLGADDGVREGKVMPNESLAQGDPRSFPAPYYLIIRYYRPGPPEIIPPNVANPVAVTSTPGGQATIASGTPTSNADGSSSTVEAIDANFPENRANWTAAILAYRENVLAKLAPRN